MAGRTGRVAPAMSDTTTTKTADHACSIWLNRSRLTSSVEAKAFATYGSPQRTVGPVVIVTNRPAVLLAALLEGDIIRSCGEEAEPCVVEGWYPPKLVL